MVLGFLVLWGAAGLAGQVDVEDPSDCVTVDALRSALTSGLGAAFQRVDVRVEVEASGDTRSLRVNVVAGPHLWQDTLEIEAADCPDLGPAITLGIRRGLTALPGFEWERLEREPTLYRVGMGLGLSGPLAPRVLVDGRAAVGRRIQGVASLRLEGSPLWRTNASRVVAVTAGLGGGPMWRRGFVELRTRMGAQVGGLWVLSRDPAVPNARRPHVAGTAGVELGGIGPFAVAIEGEISRPIYLVTAVQGSLVGVEPLFRGILSLRYLEKISRQ